jgi:uncharacterized iron-regulated membrane protein
MKVAAVASWLHKWLALIIGVQILFWFVSGLFFAVYPIERVRSEHRIAEQAIAPLTATEMRTPAEITALLPSAPTKLTYTRDATGRAIAIAELGEGRPALIDMQSLRLASPLSAGDADTIARSYIANAPRIRETQEVTTSSPEYRGALPAWRVVFDDAEGLAVYVAADTAQVTARRSDLWRIYDALWALHIMDWRDHENFNTGLLIAATTLALIVTLAGFVLIPYRMGWVSRRPR